MIGDAFMSFLVGIFLVIVAFPVLYYNELRHVHMSKIFEYAEGHIVDVSADKVDRANQACLVCVRGKTSTAETLTDPDLGIQLTDCVKLRREVEMYQWMGGAQ